MLNLKIASTSHHLSGIGIIWFLFSNAMIELPSYSWKNQCGKDGKKQIIISKYVGLFLQSAKFACFLENG